MSAATARVAARPAARPAPRPARPGPARTAPARPATRSKRKTGVAVRGGVVWIVFFGILLAGVVAVNLAVLRQNMQLDSLADERTQLREENLELGSRLSQVVSPSYIENLAQTRLGLVEAASDQTTYIQLGTGGK